MLNQEQRELWGKIIKAAAVAAFAGTGLTFRHVDVLALMAVDQHLRGCEITLEEVAKRSRRASDPSRRSHVHHIDGNPLNNAKENLEVVFDDE